MNTKAPFEQEKVEDRRQKAEGIYALCLFAFFKQCKASGVIEVEESV